MRQIKKEDSGWETSYGSNISDPEKLRNVAWWLYKIGYYSLSDYRVFCEKNELLMF